MSSSRKASPIFIKLSLFCPGQKSLPLGILAAGSVNEDKLLEYKEEVMLRETG